MSHDLLPIDWSAQIRIDEARRQAEQERWVRETKDQRQRHSSLKSTLWAILSPTRG